MSARTVSAGVLALLASSGRIVPTIAPPDGFNGGIPTTAAGEFSVSNTPSHNFTQGLQYQPAGNVCVNFTAAIIGHSRGGIPVDRNGEVCVSAGMKVAMYLRSIPLDANGRVALETNPFTP